MAVLFCTSWCKRRLVGVVTGTLNGGWLPAPANPRCAVLDQVLFSAHIKACSPCSIRNHARQLPSETVIMENNRQSWEMLSLRKAEERSLQPAHPSRSERFMRRAGLPVAHAGEYQLSAAVPALPLPAQ